MKALKLLLATSVYLWCGLSNANLITNGDFETGDFTGWSTKGDAVVATAGFLASIQGMDGKYARLGSSVTDGMSQIRQDFSIAGLTSLDISFDWTFDYFDNSASATDTFLSFVRQDGKPGLSITLQDLQTNGTGFFDPDGGFAYGSFSGVFDISAYSTPDARLIFRLDEESDNYLFTGTASVAGIDNVVVNGVSVPEPTIIALFGAGLVGLGFARRRVRN